MKVSKDTFIRNKIKETHMYTHKEYKESLTHTDVHSHVSHRVKLDAKRREQHSAIRRSHRFTIETERETERY